MADLFVLLPAASGDAPLFASRARDGWVVSEERPAGHGGRGETAIAFVPGVAVGVHAVDLVARKPTEARRTALFAIEDDVAEPVDALHVALGPAGAEGPRTLHVVSLTDMQAWTAQLQRLGLPEAGIVAPQGLLPQSRMAFEGAGEYLFRGETDAFAVDASAPADLVASVAPGNALSVHGENLARLLGCTADGPGAADRGDWLTTLGDWFETQSVGSVISLRQGPFAQRRAFSLEGVSRWQAVAGLAAAAVVLWFASMLLETSALKAEATDLRARTSELLTSALPGSQGNAERAIAMLRQDRSTGAAGLQPVPAIAALYEALAPVREAEIRALRFDAASGRLTAQVSFDDYAEADAIAERLEAAGLSVSLGAARQSGARVLGELIVEAAS